MGDGPGTAGTADRCPVDLHADVRELMTLLSDAVDRAEWLDAFLYAAGAAQAAEDRLHATWGPWHRFVDHLHDPAAADPAQALAGPARAALDASDAARLSLPPARGMDRWTAALAWIVELLAEPVLDADLEPVPAAERPGRPRGPGPELRLALHDLIGEIRRPSAVRRVLGPAVLRPPSCFCSFDQYPQDVVELARRYTREFPARDRPLLVVGVRTSGSYLAPLAGAALRRLGHRRVTVRTVRPGAPLLPRRPAELRRLLRDGGRVLLLDDPPVTGRSLARVAARAEQAGFPPDAVVPLCAVCEDDPVLPDLLRRHPSVLLGGRDWHVRELLRPDALNALVPRLLPGCRPPFEIGTQEPLTRGMHLSVPVTARLDGRDLPLVAESVGLGYLGRNAAATATALTGLVPAVHGIADGVLLRARLPGEGQPPPGDAVDPPQVARYVAIRQQRLATDADRSLRLNGRDPVWEVAARIPAPLLGRAAAALRPVLLDPVMRRLLAADLPYVVDGRTGDRNWVRDGQGHWLKTDFAEGAFSHLNRASYDAAYDLAGAALALGGRAGELRIGYEKLSGRWIPPARWCLVQLVQAGQSSGPAPGGALNQAYARRAQARAVQHFLAETFLADLPPETEPEPDGPWCVLDVDGVLETDPLGFPAGSPDGMRALRALRAHGIRPLLATGRSLPELRDRCAAYGLAGGVAEYGAVLHRTASGAVETLLPAGWEGPDAELRRRLGRLPEVTVDPLSRWTVRASVGSDAHRTGLPPDLVRDLLADRAGTGLDTRYDVVPGDRQTDFVPRGTDKARAIRALLDRLGAGGAVPVLAVGDGPADLGLLRWAARGVAPANAAAGLRAAGVEVTGGAYQAGLAEAVGRLIGHRPGGCLLCRPPLHSADTQALLAVLALPEAGRRGVPRRLLRLAAAQLRLDVDAGRWGRWPP